MTVETFFANFGHLADAPNGVQKLRELILQLAVQGKLVPQDPNDELASALLKKIKLRKEQLIKEKKIRKTKVPMAYDDEQAALPPSWMYTTLYDAGEIGPRNDFADEVEASFVPMPLISQQYNISVQSDVKKWGKIKSGFTHFAEGDVCLAKITPCFQNGKSAVMRGLKNGFGSGTTELHVFRPVEEMVCSEYVLIFLKSPLFIDEGIPRMTGSAGQKRITRDYFAGKPFPLPPLEEQKRIVAKVDQLMALCNELEARQQKQRQGRVRLNNSALDALLTAREPDEFADHWQRISTNFDLLYDHPETIAKLRAAILQLAVQGKLVPQDPNDEPALVLLERIKVEKERLVKEKIIQKSKPMPPINLDEIPFSAPVKWGWEKIERLCFVTKLAGFEYTKHIQFKERGDIPVVRAQNVRMARLEKNNLLYIDRKTSEILQRSALTKPSLLMTFIGAGIGDVAIFEESERWHLAPNVAKLEPYNGTNESLDVKYLLVFLMSETGRKEIFKHKKATAQPSLSMGTIRDAYVAVPPIEEQKRIVAKVDQLMALCNELEAKLNQSKQKSGKLMEATVRQLLVA